MNLTLIPKTKIGKFAMTFIIISIALVISVIVIAGDRETEIITGGFFGNLPLAVLTLGA